MGVRISQQITRDQLSMDNIWINNIWKIIRKKELIETWRQSPRCQIESSCHHKINNEFVRYLSTFIKIAVLSKEGVYQLGETKGSSKEPGQLQLKTEVDFPGDLVQGHVYLTWRFVIETGLELYHKLDKPHNRAIPLTSVWPIMRV